MSTMWCFQAMTWMQHELHRVLSSNCDVRNVYIRVVTDITRDVSNVTYFFRGITNFFTLYHNVTWKCRLDPQTKLEKSNSNISGVSSSFLYWFHQDFFLNISPHTFLSIFFIILIVPFENIVTCYYMIGDFTKTLKGKLTFSKSPPQAPLGYENLRERLIKPPP